MARVLSLDTTSEFGSIALLDGDNLVEELMLRSTDGFSHVIYGHLETMLARHGWTIDGVDCFAAASGPGSFTGVRVGLAAAKGLAEATGKPLAAVSNLQALAWFGSSRSRAPFLDARRGQIYGAVYDERLEPVTSEVVTSLQAWLAGLPDEIEFLSTDFTPFRQALTGASLEDARITEAPRAQAAAVGHVASIRLAAGAALDPAAVDANYVRRSDAELKWTDRD
jgi:tRNA threonylcarbamoyladenosine biosynthesis protein TsaB